MSELILNERRKKILVIDDEKDLREALFTILAAEGYEVLVAEDGVIGLEITKKEVPDLILLDLQMPNMDGKVFLEKIKSDEATKQIKIIILTALDDLQTLSQTMESGGLDYIVKSDIDLSGVVKKVAEKLA
jgi:two-component system sensor histidine kinase/response regulator